MREEKLLAVFHLFQLCYRTVIPNRPPPMVSHSNLLPNALGSFNPRPFGKFSVRLACPHHVRRLQAEKSLARSILSSANGARNLAE